MSMKPKQKQYRALWDLVYSDLLPDKQGQILARKGDITPLYPEVLKYPDRVQLLIDRGFIEEVPDVPIVRPADVDKPSYTDNDEG